MSKKNFFIIAIIIETIIVCFFSSADIGNDTLNIIISNILITALLFFLGKNLNGNMDNCFKMIVVFLIIFATLKVIIIIYEAIYTKSLINDVENIYSNSFLENINSLDELYEAINISDKEKELLTNKEFNKAFNDWYEEYYTKTLEYNIIKFTPLSGRSFIEEARIANIIVAMDIRKEFFDRKEYFENSFQKYKNYYKIYELTDSTQISHHRNEYIWHLIVLFIISTFFEIFWLIILKKNLTFRKIKI